MSGSESFFDNQNYIFANKDLLRISHLVEGDRIIGRKDELNSLAQALKDAVQGHTPNHVLIYGKTGTGKSLCSKYITKDLRSSAAENDVSIGVAYIDCLQHATETQAVRSIAREFNDEAETGISIPSSGLSTGEYYRRFWNILDCRFDVGIIILDEVDKIGDDNILMQLSRAVESGKLEDSTLGIIGISNKIRYKEELNERVKSSLSERDFVFPPYDAKQLRAILESRKDAFQDGVLEDAVIPRVAALAAKEHGDARKAIDILRYAGEIADENGAGTVVEEHVNQAHTREEQNRLAELISKQPPHSKLLLQALAFQTQQAPDDEPAIPTSDIYSTYEVLCEQEGSDPLRIRRVRELLSELSFLSIIEQTRKGRGHGKGAHTIHELVDDPELVLKACKSI
ncbi:orc1/cdc6 family replication initiation protein [Natrinema sp. SYSU A 869]|uniref:Cdc6/Cdc18 family protein n=1 Tax=Natrinema sp. SYSU A 869 TaxID=2871694 RepID=UPI001CA41511|nr:orc1/cdc6 family replication initiation protein [Natrinema sp. SYSU A 869]